MAVLRCQALNEERRSLGLRIDELSKRSGVGYGTVCRALAGKAIGRDVAARLAAALGMSLEQARASDEERRPAEGYSPEALAHFKRMLKTRVDQAIGDCHQATQAEASRRCWFWVSSGDIRDCLSVRFRIGSQEVALL